MALNDYNCHEDIIRIIRAWLMDEDTGINARLPAIAARYDDGIKLHSIRSENFIDFPWPLEEMGQDYPFCTYYIDDASGVDSGNNLMVSEGIGLQIAIFEWERDGKPQHLPKRLRRYEAATVRCIEDAHRATDSSGVRRTDAFIDPDGDWRGIGAMVYDGSRYMTPGPNFDGQLEQSVIMRWRVAQVRE